MSKLNEKRAEAEEKRNKVIADKQRVSDKAYRDYKNTVKESKQKFKEELGDSGIKRLQQQARHELQTKAEMRENANNTSINEERAQRTETNRTLETLEARVYGGRERAGMHKFSMSQKIGADVNRVI